jgi:hypothetical protein
MDDHGRFDNALSFDKNMFYFHLEPGLVVDKNNDGTAFRAASPAAAGSRS